MPLGRFIVALTGEQDSELHVHAEHVFGNTERFGEELASLFDVAFITNDRGVVTQHLRVGTVRLRRADFRIVQ